MIIKLKKYWWLSAIVVVILLLVFLRNKKEGNIETYTVGRQNIEDTIVLAGTINADNRVDLGFATAGRVSNVFFNEGDYVKKGDIIAQIDQNKTKANLSKAKASKVVTESNTQSDLDSVSIDLSTVVAQQDKIVENAYQTYLSGDLQAYIDDEVTRNLVAPTVSGTYQGEQVGEYIINVYGSNSTAGYSLRLDGLGEGTSAAETYLPGKLGDDGLFIKFEPNINYRNTTWTIPIPNTRSDSYLVRKTAYENAVATRDQVIANQTNNFNRVYASASNTSRADAQRLEAYSSINALYAELEDGRIVAPFDGFIARNELKVGQIVSAFDELITFFGSDKRELDLNVPEIYINKLKVGNTVDVIVDAYPDESFTATVRNIDIIDTKVDGVPVYQTNVVIDQMDPRIRVGMNARGRISAESVADVLAIPKHYISNKDKHKIVLISEDKKVTERIIQTGFLGNGGFAEVISGLAEGDIIIRPQDRDES